MEVPFDLAIGRTWLISDFTRIRLTAGTGTFQIDFRGYTLSAGQTIFLAPGQYVRLTGGQPQGCVQVFDPVAINQVTGTRYLFKHLIGVAFIDQPDPPPRTDASAAQVLYEQVRAWQHLNPFHASDEEIKLLFAVKEFVDGTYREPLSWPALAAAVPESPTRINTLITSKLSRTVKRLRDEKLLLEAQRTAAFTNLSTKSIAYELGFTDPAYFNRFFKRYTGQTPHAFREAYGDDVLPDPWLNDLLALVDTHYRQHREAAFFADRLSTTSRQLARRLGQKTGRSLSQLLKERLLMEAKTLLQQARPIMDVAFELGFSEPNHFSVFFRSQTGLTPTAYRMDFENVQSIGTNP